MVRDKCALRNPIRECSPRRLHLSIHPVDRFPEDVPRGHTQMRLSLGKPPTSPLLVYTDKRGGERANRDARRGGAKRKKEKKADSHGAGRRAAWR